MVVLLPGVKAAEITGVSFGVQVGNQAYNYTTDDYNSLRPQTERVNSILEDVNPLPLFINTSETPGDPSESFTPIQNPYTQLGTVFNLVSSNPGVVTIDNQTGLFTIVRIGSSTITVQSVSGSVSSLNAPDGQVKSFEFVVLDPRQPEPPKVWADSIQISPTEVNLTTQPGQNTVQMHYTVTPANCTEDIDFESTNRNVAYVSDTGVVTARNAGTATIIVEADDYVTSTATVNVSTGASTGVPATGISIAPTSAQMTVGQTLQLNATVTPANSTDAVVWSSSNSGVASVAGNGLVTANASGSAVITATAGSVSTSATITVQAPAPSPEPDVPNTPPVNPNNRLTVSPEKAYLTTIQGEGNQNSVTLTVTGQVGNLEFESSAPRVAQVSPQGVVTAISPGRATIEIEDSRDYTAYCTVIVGDGSLVSDGIVVTANNPDSFDVTVKNIAGNPAIAGSAGFTPEKVSIFTWSGYEQLDMNAKQATRIEGTNDFTYSFPVNNNEANNYYFNADNIIINAYASSTPDSDGNLVGTGVYSWINRATAPYKNVGYIAYSQNIGFDRPTVFDYDVAGTTGEGLQMEGLRVSSAIDDVHIATSLHVENIGWMQAVPDGEYAGTMHQNLQVEAVKLALYGEDANEYYLQYQVYVENLGWMDPVNTLIGNQDEIYAGTIGRGLQVEAIRIQILHR